MKKFVFLIFLILSFSHLLANDNKLNCESFCKNDDLCSYCSVLKGCGTGFKNIRSFRGKGKNWHACKKKGSINTIWKKQQKVTKEQRVLIVGIGGYSGMYSDDGVEQFCENYFNSKNNKNVLCISAYGRPKTSSKQLSDNIRNTALLMEKISGVIPKVILVGKSIGACKLHHSVAGEKGGARGDLETFPIDLFIGIDMSCQIKRHFESPGDILLFRNNIKEFYNFYQNNKDSAQTGCRAYFLGKKFDDSVHIDVNNDNFDVENSKKIKNSKKPLCKDVKHLTIDDCEPLLKTIQKIILKAIQK